MIILKHFVLTISFIFAVCLSTSYSQVSIKGKVVDAITGDALIGANVMVKAEEGKGTVTDFDGEFELRIGSLPVELTVAYIGYEDQTYVVNTQSQKIIIKLGESAVLIDLGVEIKGQRVTEKQKAAPLTVESIDAIAIKQTASTDFYNGLGSLKGVDLTTASLGFTVVNTRGFNSTSPVRSLQTIDGVDNQSPGLNFSLGNFLGASELDIQKVDLVVGASSAFYGPNAFNGVIAMETKNPFFNRGLAASIKVGERNLMESAFRFADVFNNKSGMPVVAYKLNFSYLKANDWVADNYDPITDSEGNNVFASPKDNPGGYNAVNIYGDEYFTKYETLYDQRAGLNTFNRNGYKEIDLVDYNTKNIKAGATIHIRTNPLKDFESPELILSSNFGYGTTVYQGDNRFSLRGIQFYQHKLEFRKRDKYFIRAYATHEDAGDSFDPYFTAQKMLEAAGTNENWRSSYEEWWTRNSLGRVFKQMQEGGYPTEPDEWIKWQQEHKDDLIDWHQQAEEYANKANKSKKSLDFFEPGTVRFDSLFNAIVSRKNNSTENGTRFFDKSALYHIHGEYKFNSIFFKELVVGANARMYKPNSDGTIFIDSLERITNKEFGIYGGASKQFGNFTLSLAARLDKNQNFDFLFSPAGSVVWNPSDNNYLRASFSSAIRNPTLTDQYLNLRIGPARLIGNINGFNDLVTYESFKENNKNTTSPLVSINIPAIQPEKVQTFELGYRTTLFDRLYVDASAYINRYRNFIGYQIGLDIPIDTIYILGSPPILSRNFIKSKVYRVSANSKELVISRGFAIGANYYVMKYYSLNGNYSYNELVTDVKDEIVPAFNTPKHKYNLGISGRDIPLGSGRNSLGFNINYKWIQGFTYEGSPQFTGEIPTYDLVDAQVNYTLVNQNLVFKLGAANALNNKQFQTYGGPRIGRMAYFSITYDFKQKI